MITDYHASYYAHELSRIGGSGVDRLGRALFDACVDLNPHQIEAALFALRSPLSKGVLLADEVGLGKTIEAGLALCQHRAERRRNILVVSPVSLRKQWALELSEKFNLQSIVLDAKTYKDQQKLGIPDPFRDKRIIICSMHFAAARADEIKAIAWDVVVIDEAHKLRNAYRESNQLGQRIRWATEDRKKNLLTATPLQNSLLELYGFSTLIDDRLFGDLASFRTRYINYGGDYSGLRERLGAFCRRSLRSQVGEFVRYAERKLITRPFRPTEQEYKLYEEVSSYLKREGTYAFPSGQKHLLILLVRKVLASSPRALAGTLEILRNRLLKLRDEARRNASAPDLLLSGDDIDDDVLGSIEDGVDFERRVLEIYQECRGEEEIQAAFEKLRNELDEQIQTKMRDARKMLLEHFDEDVHDRLKVNLAGTRERLDRIGRLFWAVTRHILQPCAAFDAGSFSFILRDSPLAQASPGRYHLISKTRENASGEYLYRLSHPLGEYVLHEASSRPCPPAEVVFDISGHPTRIAMVERLKGRSGWLGLQHLRVESFASEEYLLFSGIDDAGANIDQETCEKFFNCDGQVRAIRRKSPGLNARSAPCASGFSTLKTKSPKSATASWKGWKSTCDRKQPSRRCSPSVGA
jgi:hypothetical protein